MTHRALILAANAPQVCLVENALESLDSTQPGSLLGSWGPSLSARSRCLRCELSPCRHLWAEYLIAELWTTLRLLLGQAARFPEVTVFDGDVH